MQPTKCVAWSPKGLDDSISFPPSFYTPSSNFHILGALIRSISFVELFVVEILHENFGMIFNLPMFAIFSLCYAQHSRYLFHTMFPSPSILQHYVEFGTHTIVTLEKLLGARFFCGFIGHLICRHATLLTYLGNFNLFFVVRTTALAFLGVRH